MYAEGPEHWQFPLRRQELAWLSWLELAWAIGLGSARHGPEEEIEPSDSRLELACDAALGK